METPLIIGLTGFARAGKDTAATALIHERGYQRFGFADLLKKFVLDVDPYVQTTPGSFERVSEVVGQHGWEKAKEFDDVRRLLQRTGTEGGRMNLGQNVWVEPVMRKVTASPVPVVITDVRFPNEVEAVRRAGGYVVRVVRPGLGAVNAHSSDAGIAALSVDTELVNDGTVEELHASTLRLARYVETGPAALVG